MRITLVLKPYAIEVYSYENSVYTLVGIEETTRIQEESLSDYEKRMIFVCKDLCSDMRASPFFKAVAKKVEGIDIILCAPWCVYDVMQVEKDLEKPTRIEESQLNAMRVKKAEDDVYIVESYTSNILLNGYSVQKVEGQMAEHIQFQYVHIYANKSFATALLKAIESVFHTHKVVLTSVYGLVERMTSSEKKLAYELRVIIEEESVDIAYTADGLHIVNTFVPYSYKHLEEAICQKLAANPEMVTSILESRYQTMQSGILLAPGKSAKKLWPDLDQATKDIVNVLVAESIDQVIKSIRDCVDSIGIEYTKDFVAIRIFCLDQALLSLYGNELSDHIKNDAYIGMKIRIAEEPISITHIF
ncbi:MAG: hypothetical protein V4576_02450 [Patescibacteria group bacterium]